MPLKVTVGTAQKDVAKGEVTVSNVQKRMTRIEAWNGSAWKVVQSFAPAMTLNVTPDVEGASSSPSGGIITSAAAFAVPVGGVGPFSYAWTKVSGDTLTVTTPNNANTSFRGNVGPGNLSFAIYRCTATDSLGTTASGDTIITLTNNSEV